MKRLIRHYTIDTFCLWVIANTAEGIVFENGIKTLLIAGLGVTTVSLLAKPVINLLLLPINLITFGLFRFISSAVVIYLVSLIFNEFKVLYFIFDGYSGSWIDIPKINLNGFAAYIAFSLLLSAITSFIYWLIK